MADRTLPKLTPGERAALEQHDVARREAWRLLGGVDTWSRRGRARHFLAVRRARRILDGADAQLVDLVSMRSTPQFVAQVAGALETSDIVLGGAR
jgi:hypothetical protein